MKIVQLFRSLFFLFTFLSVAHTLSYAQNFECGNSELTSTEMQDYLNAVSSMAAQGEVAITIQDRTGRTVYHTSSYPTGVHNYNFRDINALANGILNYTVSLGGEVKYTGQIIKF